MEEDYSIYISREKSEEIKAFTGSLVEQIFGVGYSEEQLKDCILKLNPLKTREEKLALAGLKIAEFWSDNLSFEFCLNIANEAYSEWQNEKNRLTFDPCSILIDLGIKDAPVEASTALVANILKNLPDYPEERLIIILSALGFTEPEKVFEMVQTLGVEELEEQVPKFECVEFDEGTPELAKSRVIFMALMLYYTFTLKPIGGIEDSVILGLYLAKQVYERFKDEYQFVRNNLLSTKNFDLFEFYMKYNLMIETNISESGPVWDAINLFETYYQTYENTDHLLQQLHQKLEESGYARISLNDNKDREVIYKMYHEWCEEKGIEELWQPDDLYENPLEIEDKLNVHQSGIDIPSSSDSAKDEEKGEPEPQQVPDSENTNDRTPLLPQPKAFKDYPIKMRQLYKELITNGYIKGKTKEGEFLYWFSFKELDVEPDKIYWQKGAERLKALIDVLYTERGIKKSICEYAEKIFIRDSEKSYSSIYKTPVDYVVKKELKDLINTALKYEYM